MSKRPTPAPVPLATTQDTSSAERRRRLAEIDALSLIAALLCIALGLLSRQALNPDGVSYLDLARAAQHGDWQHFVQGYWSPLFPLLTGVIGVLTGFEGSTLVPVTHVISTVAAVAAVFILWRWSRAATATRPIFGRLAIAAMLLCSAGVPRIEAVTPDVLLLLIAVGLSHELLVHSGRRWMLTGLLLGISFVVKTSSWPWLLVAVPLRLWAAPDPVARRRVWRSAGICMLVMLAWIVPLSVKAGRPTLGSSGRLNYSWYIDANSSRLPDGDQGVNASYRQVPIGNGQSITVATFDAASWTYEPWGDPTAWSEREISDVGRAPTLLELTGYWLRMLGRVFGLWLGPMLLTTVVPAYLLYRRKGMVRELMRDQRNALMVALLGLAGLLQFVAVHAEPRLLAPYGIMLALGAIWGLTAPGAGTEPRPAMGRGVRLLVAWIGIGVALGFAVPKFVDAVPSAARLAETTERLDLLKQRLASELPGVPVIGIVGPAVPVLSAVYWSGARVAMQILPRSVELLRGMPTDQRDALLMSVFGGQVPMIWNTEPNGGVQMLMVPKAPR